MSDYTHTYTSLMEELATSILLAMINEHYEDFPDMKFSYMMEVYENPHESMMGVDDYDCLEYWYKNKAVRRKKTTLYSELDGFESYYEYTLNYKHPTIQHILSLVHL